jgi:hypothetical protein
MHAVRGAAEIEQLLDEPRLGQCLGQRKNPRRSADRARIRPGRIRRPHHRDPRRRQRELSVLNFNRHPAFLSHAYPALDEKSLSPVIPLRCRKVALSAWFSLSEIETERCGGSAVYLDSRERQIIQRAQWAFLTSSVVGVFLPTVSSSPSPIPPSCTPRESETPTPEPSRRRSSFPAASSPSAPPVEWSA